MEQVNECGVAISVGAAAKMFFIFNEIIYVYTLTNRN